MAQTFTATKPESGVTTFGELYQIIRDHNSALRSNFSGTSFPPNAVAGQRCWRSDRGANGYSYVFTGNTSIGEGGWVSTTEATAIGIEIISARGSKPTLDQRLDVVLNEDGTLKDGASVNYSEWVSPPFLCTYLSTNSFSVQDDQTDIYVTNRRLKVNLDSSFVYTYVQDANYDGTDTTVTTVDAVLDNTLVSVEHSLILNSVTLKSLGGETLVQADQENTFTGANTFTEPVSVGEATAAGHAVTKGQLDLSSGVLQKPVMFAPLLTKTAPDTVQIPANTRVYVGGKWVSTASAVSLGLDTDLDTGVKAAGTDYCVYAKADGTFYLSVDRTITADQLIGGFHYGLVPHTEAPSGNKTEADMVKLRGINAYSLWDLKWLPSNGDARGMFYGKGRWYDIYLMDEDYALRGYPKAGVRIAGGAADANGRRIPKIPLAYGGDGTVTYGKFTWFQAAEVAASAGKRLMSAAEFPTVAYGVSENVSSSTGGVETVAGMVEHYPTFLSKFGMEQATGVQWVWGADIGTASGTAWASITDSRGQVYGDPKAVLHGGDRTNGASFGSRCSSWSSSVSSSYWSFGARFACDHLMLA